MKATKLILAHIYYKFVNFYGLLGLKAHEICLVRRTLRVRKHVYWYGEVRTPFIG